MAKPSSKVAVSAKKKNNKRQRDVVVVHCPSDFPTSSDQPPPRATVSSSEYRPRQHQKGTKRKKERFLDWNDTVKEIHSYGATTFEGKQKRTYQDEEYERLTGRKKKHQKVPLKIVRGIRKKAQEREARQLEEAREAGLVMPVSKEKKKKRRRDRTSDIHGPAPSIGFISKGMLKVKTKQR